MDPQVRLSVSTTLRIATELQEKTRVCAALMCLLHFASKIKTMNLRAGETAQRLRALVAIAEDLG